MKAASSLFSRFAASTAILAVGIVVLSFFAFHTIRGDFFRDSFETPLDEWSAFLAGHIGADPDVARTAAQNHQMGVAVTTPTSEFAFAPNGMPVSREHLSGHHGSARTIAVQSRGGVEHTFYLRDSVTTTISASLLWSLLGGVAFLVGVLYLVQLSHLRPLRWLKEGVDRVSEGHLSTRVPIVRNDEIGQVGRAFNHMTGRVEQMLNDQDRLMADVSHELRSPLARIKVALEMLPSGSKRDQIATDIREMESLTSMLLERERIKVRAAQPKKVAFDPAALADEVVEAFVNVAPGVLLHGSASSMSITADRDLVKILLQNLLDNALKFSTDDSDAVAVAITTADNDVVITVDDDGVGIPDDMHERILEPFVKLDPARGHRSGYGLGLNLCQRIVEAHDGELRFESQQPRGTRVSVILPAS